MTTQDLTQFNELKAEITDLVAPGKAITVTDFPSAARAAEAAKQVKALAKKVEERRKALTDPLLQQQRKIKQYADEISAPLDEVETHLKAQLRAFEIEQEKIRAEERRKAEEEARRKEAELRAKQEADRAEHEANLARQAKAASAFGDDDEEPTQTLEAQHDEFEAKQMAEQAALKNETAEREWNIKQQGVKGAVKDWKVDIIDINLVPIQYLKREVMVSLVKQAARNGVTDFPGLRVYQDISISIGANTYIPREALGVKG